MSNVVDFPGASATPITITAGIEHYIALILARGLSANTAHAYRSDLTHFARFVVASGAGELVCVQSARTISRFLDDQDARGISKRSQARRLTCLRMFFRHARKEGWIGHDPCRDESVHFQTEFVLAPELAQFHQVIDAIPRDTAWDLRDRALLRLMLDTGMRIASTDTGMPPIMPGILDCPPAGRAPGLSM